MQPTTGGRMGRTVFSALQIASLSCPDSGSPSAASTPSSSAASPPADVSTSASASSSSSSAASSSSSVVPRVAIRPNTAAIQPPQIRTSVAINRMASIYSVDSPSPTSDSRPMSMTSKEWVIPPRPKPGRKPATDTPPTKRKAQNRAAQRAFRERRAARVGELEEQLDEQKEDHDRTVREMQDRISHLEIETQTLQSRCQWLESMLEKERQGRVDIGRNWDDAQQPMLSRNNVMLSAPMQPQTNPMRPSHAAPQLHQVPRRVAAGQAVVAEPRAATQPFSISQIISPPDEGNGALSLSCGSCNSDGLCACADEVLRDASLTIGCGGCTIDSRCACLEQSIRESMANELKRPLPPSSPSPLDQEEKRQRSDAGVNMETDFTAMFASKKYKEPVVSAIAQPVEPESQSQQPPQHQLMVSVEPRDSCGFCKDGGYCVCAESIALSASMAASSGQQMAQQTRTPPPSENDVVPMPMEVTATGAIKLPSFRSLRQNRGMETGPQTQPKPSVRTASGGGGGCGPNGPGTCAQCLSDPVSGLFCRSLAANFERNNRQQPGSGTASGGCCGNGGPDGCCKSGNSSNDAGGSGSNNNPAPAAPAIAPPKPASGGLGLSLSCADAYKTIASHRHFDEAADDIGSWLPKLRAVPIPPDHVAGYGRGHLSGGRAPIEVEAASIMSVLKGFDVRFGRGE
ncbi:hypothetical protein B0T22DRAFT_529244 [Podospora appendiculata]|uniref:BZIP domain-containing protein n=1 Tax=Podospora appendiculata TaxID=314037 RepID=A0AAE1CA48_9PEZI|nr:hypothetical protein B0T22DRAFT_529244 [Podospora appendiculata]